MKTSRWPNVLIALCLSFLLIFGMAACAKAPSPYDQVQKETTGFRAQKAVDKKATQGAKFNKFFPSGVRGYEIIPTQEKKGFAEYKVNKDGKTVAMLSISDTTSVPTAAAKFDSATEKVAGYPSVEQGSSMTSILVSDRYQVKVLSRDITFTKEDRVAWLQKFNLRGLASLEASLPAKQKTDLNAKQKAPWQQAPSLRPQPAT